MSGDPLYCYPGSEVLRNKFGLTDFGRLDAMERRLVSNRFAEGAPAGRFDLDHLRAIHRNLFQDIYEWAGELRLVEISKGGTQFMFRRFIENGMQDVHRRIVEASFLRGIDSKSFAAKAGNLVGDINHIHPFREGNGRTQMTYLRQLGEQAGHRIDVRRIGREQWYEASRAANIGDYALMGEAILRAIV